LYHFVVIAEDIAKSTPLHEAVRKNWFSLAIKLVEAGANATHKDITEISSLYLEKERIIIYI
jgi:hypothetical protein